MKKIQLFLFLTSLLTYASLILPNETYFKDNTDKQLTYIYSKAYQKIIPKIKVYQKKIISQYEKEFGYTLDDRLYVSFASLNNQIANGFSTQLPFNSQLFYGTGSFLLDYFNTTSWLKMLIIHETAHNFQLNAKENPLSRFEHAIVGNTPFGFFGFYPLFPVPNLYLSSFLLEGNAVLNESHFGIGGRAFSGYALAQSILLAKAGKITPSFLINDTMLYPYREHFYLTGGLFQVFLAQKYSVTQVNQFFKKYSNQYFPFFLNYTFENHFNQSFDSLIEEFKNTLLHQHKDFKTTQGKPIATSQIAVPLNRDKREIFTLLSQPYRTPELFKLTPKKFSLEKRSFPIGEVFKKDNHYYTQSSRQISPTQIIMGLFDDEAHLLPSTHSKVIQGFLNNQKMVYIDINQSLENPHIYIDNHFYDSIHSNAYTHKNDIYYFKQKKKIRTLYKNKKALFSFKGYYGYVVEVGRKGEIYFIASSQHGSTLYKFENQTLYRVSDADDIIDMKLISRDKMLLQTVCATGINLIISSMKTPKKEAIYNYQYPFETNYNATMLDNENFVEQKSLKKAPIYSPLYALKYSTLSQDMNYDEEGFYASINAYFTDPLQQNNLSLFLGTYPTYTIGSLRYENSQNLIRYGASGTLVFQHNQKNAYQDRDYGYKLFASYPFLASGYLRGSLLTQYSYPFDSAYQKPFTLALTLQKKKQFFLSKYPNLLHQFSLYGSQDRENFIGGGYYHFMHTLSDTSYLKLGLNHLYSSTLNPITQMGVEIRNEWMGINKPYTSLRMPSLPLNLFVKKASLLQVGLFKVFNFSSYSSWFPLSLHRETLYTKYKMYRLSLEQQTQEYYESILGIELDLLLLNETTSPFRVEWIHNKATKDKDIIRFGVSLDI